MPTIYTKEDPKIETEAPDNKGGKWKARSWLWGIEVEGDSEKDAYLRLVRKAFDHIVEGRISI